MSVLIKEFSKTKMRTHYFTTIIYIAHKRKHNVCHMFLEKVEIRDGLMTTMNPLSHGLNDTPPPKSKMY